MAKLCSTPLSARTPRSGLRMSVILLLLHLLPSAPALAQDETPELDDAAWRRAFITSLTLI